VPKVISIGNTCLDIILSYADQLPNWNSELLFEKSEWRLGGQGANFAIASANLGLKQILISSIGKDDVGDRLSADLTSASIDKRLFKREDSGTGFSVTLIRRDGERLFLTFLGHQAMFNARRMMKDVLGVIEVGDIVHISGLYNLPGLKRELTSVAKRLKRAGAMISFDPGWNPDGFSKRTLDEFYRTLSHVDFYEPNDAELMQLAGETSLDLATVRVKRRYQGALVVKLGKYGSKVIDSSNRVTAVRPYRTLVADTTGAGDVFDAGLIAGIVHDQDLGISARFGNAAASIAISRRGNPSARFPKYHEVQRHIGDQ
jgi:ribokinase